MSALGILRLLPAPLSKRDSSRGFCFCDSSLSFPHSRLSASMAQHSKWISNEIENQNFSTTTLHFSSDTCIDDRIRNGRPNLRDVV
ncbi:hypothetical protein AVEN_65910-1 [Araneus ventricosus]|uniref:Uncharacterized protein n=1 Tax=Araneus ventricosus TaxID=182803 RepID=A0A4Y2QFM9_ARAVE|nr:hypothetical protein AVEN_65910-1 [Araneus ventricosus]